MSDEKPRFSVVIPVYNTARSLEALSDRIDRVFTEQLGETYELIFSQGSFLAGIHEAASRPAAERMADILNQRLKGIISE